MKRNILLILAFLLIPSLVWAAGTCTQNLLELGRDGSMWELTFTCTADDSAATFPATAVSDAYMAQIKGKYLSKVITNPGSTAPTDDYDITITDADGIDIMGGTLANRDTSTSEEKLPYVGSLAYGPTPINSTLTLNITNNLVNSAITVVKLIISR